MKKIFLVLSLVALGFASSRAEVSHEQWAQNALLESKKIEATARKKILEDMGCDTDGKVLKPQLRASSKCNDTAFDRNDKIENHQQHQDGKSPTLLVFVSFTLPKETLKVLVESVQKVGGIVVVRGLVDNSFVKTAVLLKDLKGGVQLDPKLFETYQIKSVPTFILEKADQQDRLTGNVSLNYVLEKFSQQGDVKEEAEQFLNRLRG